MSKEFIVKVQLSSPSAAEPRKCLICNEDGSVKNETHATLKIVQMMKGRTTQFFWVFLESDGQLTFGENAPDQDW